MGGPLSQTDQPPGGIPAPVSSSFCIQQMSEFIIEQMVPTFGTGRFSIKDARGHVLFQVKGKDPLALHARRVLRDASGSPVVILKKKNMSIQNKWAVYRGKSDSDNNLLFTMSKSSILQFKPRFDIFLTSNKSNQPDFVVKGDFFSHHYVVLFRGNTIAETRKKIDMYSATPGKDQYGVTLVPGVDQAFIAAIVVVVDQVKQDDDGDKSTKEGVNVGQRRL